MPKSSNVLLIVVLVVVGAVVLGLVLVIGSAMIVPRLMGHSDDAKRARAMADVSELQTAATTFRLNTDRYPSTKEGLGALMVEPKGIKDWRGPYLMSLPADPWGHAYQYKDLGPDETPVITSLGADGAEGGSGDGMDVSNRDDVPPK